MYVQVQLLKEAKPRGLLESKDLRPAWTIYQYSAPPPNNNIIIAK